MLIRRVAQLEEKLDGIVTLLKSSQQQTSPENRASAPSLPNEPGLMAPERSEQFKWPITPPQSTPQSYEIDSRYQIPNLAVPSNHDLFRNDPDSLLTLYRCYMTDQFPFVVIPLGMTADDLRRSRPFLLKTILMVASVRDMAGQTSMAEDIMDYVAEHMIKRGEKSLDLLQGLLVFMAWYVDHSIWFEN